MGLPLSASSDEKKAHTTVQVRESVQLSPFATFDGRERIIAAVRQKAEEKDREAKAEEKDREAKAEEKSDDELRVKIKSNAEKRETSYKKSEEYLKQNNFDKVLNELYMMRDLDLGIDSSYVTVNLDDSKEEINVFLRDARNQPSMEERIIKLEKENKDSPDYHPQNFYQGWAILGLGFLKNANKLLKNNDPAFDDFVKRQAIQFLTAIKNSPNPELVFLVMINEHLIPKLKELNKSQHLYELALPEKEKDKQKKRKKMTDDQIDEAIRHQLWIAKEFGNFSQPNCVMATQVSYSYDGNKTADELSVCVPVAGQMGTELDKQYQLIKNLGKDVLEGWYPGGINVPWFDKQDFFTKRLIIENIDKIRTNQIPTQLRKILVGARNLSHSSEFIRKQGEAYTEKVNFYHMGFPADPAIDEAASHVLAQLERLTDAKELNIHSLINSTALNKLVNKPEENKVDGQLRKFARKKSNLHYSNSPAQVIGVSFERPVDDSANILKKVQEVIGIEKDRDTKSLRYDLYLIRQQYLGMKDSGTEALGLWDAIKNIKAIDDNLHFVALEVYMHFLTMKIKWMEAQPEDKPQIKKELAYFICCMSGKDRTGALREYISMLSTYHSLTGEIPTVDFMRDGRMSAMGKEIRNKRLASAQASTYAGWSAGCSIGALGTLESHKSGEFSGMFAADSPTLVERTARANKEPKKLKTKLSTKKKIALLILTVIGVGLLATGFGGIAGVAVLASAAAVTMTTLHMSTLALGVTAIGVSVGAAVGAKLYSKFLSPRSAPYLPQKWSLGKKIAFCIAVGLGVALCASGIGAVAGAPILAATAAVVAATGSTAAVIAGFLALGVVLGLVKKERSRQNKIEKIKADYRSSAPKIEMEEEIPKSGRGIASISTALKDSKQDVGSYSELSLPPRISVVVQETPDADVVQADAPSVVVSESPRSSSPLSVTVTGNSVFATPSREVEAEESKEVPGPGTPKNS